MNTQKITQDISWVGVDDHQTELFEGLWPLDNGISYNAYVINDEKVAVIDAVKDFECETYLEKIKSIIGDKPVDYLVVNHMEPDHSSGISELRAAYPGVTIVANQKALPMLKNFYGIEEGIQIVADGDTLELGAHCLSFHMTPMVHWPESMVTYDQKDKVLFSMDVFGSFKATDGVIFDDENSVESFVDEIYRYFACIIGKVRLPAAKALKKLGGLEIKTICPSHGLVWRENPGYILDLYTRMANAETENGVVIAYGSMYGNTKHSAELLAEYLGNAGVETVKLYDVAVTDLSYILSDIWRYKGLLLGAPAYYGQLFPKMATVLYKLAGNKLQNHALGIFTGYSWSGGAEKPFAAFAAEAGGVHVGQTVSVQGWADAEDEAALKELAQSMANFLKLERA